MTKLAICGDECVIFAEKMIRSLLILLISVVFWNLENFFDYTDNGSSTSDTEFSSRGNKHWTKKKFLSKAEMVGKTILWAGMPDVAGFAEVENACVMKSICRSEILDKCGYRFVHFDSPDPRGIDVGLIYRDETMEYVLSRPIRVDSLRTRDILYVQLREKSDGTLWHFFVNHHPSKLGGSSKSALKRNKVMALLRNSVDSLFSAGETHIVAMGDFNDEPQGQAFSLICPPLENLGLGIISADNNCGTIRFRGKWELIDNFLVSPSVGSAYRMEILRPSFLLERDGQFPGEKPARTYKGPRYNGGLSDHLPVALKKN